MSAHNQQNLRTDEHGIWTLVGWCLIGLAGWATVCLTLIIPELTPGFVRAIKLIVLLTTCMVGFQAHLAAHSATQAARVLGQRQVPERLWSARFKSTLTLLNISLTISVLSSMVLLAIAESPWRWATGAALMSVSASCIFLRGVAAQGFLPRPLGWAVWVGLALLVGLVWGQGGVLQGLDFLAELPIGLQVLALATWPALYGFLAARWSQRTPRPRWVGDAVELNVGRRVALYMKRYVSLQYLGSRFPNAASRSAKDTSLNWRIFVSPVYLLSFFESSLPRAVPSWNSALPLEHIPITVVLIIFALCVLVCKDWHWRALLAPGGLRRGRLGTHIFLSTLQLVVFVGVALWFLSVVFDRMMGGTESYFSMAALQRYLLLPVQVVFAVAVANVVMALRKPWMGIATLISLLLLSGLPGIFENTLPAPPDWFRAGLGYVAALLALTVAAIWLSNRLWTAQKLMIAASALKS